MVSPPPETPIPAGASHFEQEQFGSLSQEKEAGASISSITDSSPYRRYGFVLNPTAGGGRALVEWENLEPLLVDLGDWTVRKTTQRGNAGDISSSLLRDGYNVIISVGGDGTHNEVINGCLRQSNQQPFPSFEIAFFSFGTGGDFQRSLGQTDLTTLRLVELLKNGQSLACDAGVLKCLTLTGEECSRYFINISSCGIGGRICYGVDSSSLKDYLSGKLLFFLHSFRCSMSWTNKPLRWRYTSQEEELETPHSEWHEGNCYLISVCNGQAHGGGLYVAPRSSLSDGEFDVVVFTDCGFKDIGVFYKTYSGDHLDPKHRNIVTAFRCKKIWVEPDPSLQEDILIEADGEVPGKLPASWEILPHCLRIIMPDERIEWHSQTRPLD